MFAGRFSSSSHRGGMNEHSPLKLQLDESDATSMTTTSTSGTPSPYNNNCVAPMNSASLSMPSSTASSPNCSSDDTPTFSRIKSLLSPKRRPSDASSSSEDSPNCLDITPQHPITTDGHDSSYGDWSDDSDGYDKDWKNSQTPLRRGAPWTIQQALFPDEETENHAPVLCQKKPAAAPMQPQEYFPQPPQPIRTRKSGVARVEQGFLIPEHRRRRSTNSNKCRASPQPLPSSSSLLRGSPDVAGVPEPPHSQSKSKKYKKRLSRELDLPGLEDRVNSSLHGCGSDMSSGAFSIAAAVSPNNPTNWRTIICRLRLTTFVWGLIMIGLTSLGRTAVLTSGAFWDAQPPPAPPLVEKPRLPTAGLRGSLLLATVGRDHSNDAPIKRDSTSKKKKVDDKKTKTAKKKEEKTKPKKSKEKKAKPSVKTDDRNEKDKLSVTEVSTFSSVAKPPPLDPADAIETTKYNLIDSFMFRSSSSKRHATYQRVVMLHEDVIAKSSSNKPIAPRKVEQYPAEFTDYTQYYGELDSSDERLRKMEMREPYSEGECVPMQDWQTTFHPSCNGVHELGVEYLGEQTTETNVQLFGTKGYWRYAWRLDLRKRMEKYGDTVVLKTLKYRHDFEDAHFEHDRVDAVAMERLTASPHVIDVFGFCGHSVLTEFADGPRLGELADKSKSKPLARLKIARDVANGLADVHGIDDKDGNNATFVHLDVNPANVISVGGTLKLNDFNIGIIRKWNTTSQEPCGFPAQYPNPQWRSPEESRNEQNLTEKVDVFALGHIFFRLICGHEPWNKLEPGGRPSKEVINDKVQQGKLPFIPEAIMKTTDPEIAAIRDAMLDCYKADPGERPKARDIAKRLEAVLERLAAGKAVTI